MKEENEQRHQKVLFNENNIIDAKIGWVTSMIGKLSIENRQLKGFKLICVKTEADLWHIQEWEINITIIKIETDSMTGMSYDGNRSFNKNNNYFRGRITLEMIEIEITIIGVTKEIGGERQILWQRQKQEYGQ